MFITPQSRRAAARPQRGMSLLFSLLALAALSLAGVALVRSVNTSSQVIGNLGFKQDATTAASRATEAAIVWLKDNSVILDANHPDAGYYATSLESMDPTGRTTTTLNKLGLINWDSDGCAYAVPDTFANCSLLSWSVPAAAGDTTSSRYLISRLCEKAEPMSGTNICAKPAAAALTDAVCRGVPTPGSPCYFSKLVTSPYYRIIVRTVGARNTVSYTETIVHF
jgi:type IV pilus assembly protein PilX